jgi:hypothetical protein
MNLTVRSKGCSTPGSTVVRCSKGQLFKTSWIEARSLRAVRLRPSRRYQRCPVGERWAIARPVKDAEAKEHDRLQIFEI